MGALRPLKNPSLVVSDFASIEFGFFRALHAQINPFLVAFTRIIVGKFMLVGEEFFYCKAALAQQGGQGGPWPPWNFKNHVILPYFATKRHKLAHFHEIFSTWPPEFETLCKRCKGNEKLNILKVQCL